MGVINLKVFILKAMITVSALLVATTATTQTSSLNTVITDGTQLFAEGIMIGWDVQVDGITLCNNPYVIGRYISCNKVVRVDGKSYQADTTTRVWPETNGVLGAMAIVNSKNQIACTGPTAWSREPVVYCNR